jgi:hypothetical protein
VALCGLMAAGCSREPGAHPNEVLFWRIASSEVAFGEQCSDEPEFRAAMEPIAFDANTYLIYRVNSEATAATSLRCQSFDVSSCTESENGLVFDVAGSELLLSQDAKQPIGSEGCQLHQAQSWTLSDRGEQLDMSIVSVLSLIGAPAACAKIEQGLVNDSPNQRGFQGCVVTFSVGADRR